MSEKAVARHLAFRGLLLCLVLLHLSFPSYAWLSPSGIRGPTRNAGSSSSATLPATNLNRSPWTTKVRCFSSCLSLICLPPALSLRRELLVQSLSLIFEKLNYILFCTEGSSACSPSAVPGVSV